ncbi:hypothetical protein B0A55_07626 [Friedmanniomyces simplex]|uniref:Uncharacterized protein n=1 Tax=Friedmanniomyces simplex TaxID=329884 RepID=A0A4U0XCF6_9PEZI|nr:hypothetical protein B0A55_07626 [Friedmanniomyces simplex]
MLDHDPVSENTMTLLHGEMSTHPFFFDRVLPEGFLTIEDARSYLDPLLEATTRLRKELLEVAEHRVALIPGAPFSHALTTCLSLCVSRALNPQAHQPLFARLARLRTTLAYWSSSLTPLTLTNSSSQTASRALALMQIQHFTATFTLTALTHQDETFTDALHPDFTRTLDLCEQYLHSTSSDIDATRRRACQPSPAETVQGGFSLEPRILPALNLVVHRCRHPGTRRRAIDILRASNRREGLFFSPVLCLSGEAYIAIEEGRVPSSSSSSSSSAPTIITITPPLTPPSSQPLNPSPPTRFAETLTAGSDVTGTDTRYFLDPITTTPQPPTLPPWRYAEVLVAGNTGPPPSMTMWCGRFVGAEQRKRKEEGGGAGGDGYGDEGGVGIEIVQYQGQGWPLQMERVWGRVFACEW